MHAASGRRPGRGPEHAARPSTACVWNGMAQPPLSVRRPVTGGAARERGTEVTIACADCGTLQDLPALPPGATALCPTCHGRLERTAGRSLVAALACSLATFILLFPANLLPLMSVTMLGVTRHSRIGSGVVALWNHQWVIIAVLVGAFAVVLPFVRFGLLSVVLASLRLQHRPHWLGRTFRWSEHLDLWAMPDVFLLGCAVGYSRIAANLTVVIGPGGFCFIGAAVLCMLSRAALDRRTVWRAIATEHPPPAPGEAAISCAVCDLVLPAAAHGSRCPRCGLRLHFRKPDAIIRTTALVIAGFALYIPANVYPMSTAVQLGTQVPHRIVDGVRQLFQAGLWPLGILIICSSVAIPLLKLVGLSWFMLEIRCRSRSRLVLRTRLYRIIDEVGRWSNIDVFTIAVFAPLLQFGALASAHASKGATAFLLVVVLTMIASRTFDPRLMWDAGLADAA